MNTLLIIDVEALEHTWTVIVAGAKKPFACTETTQYIKKVQQSELTHNDRRGANSTLT